MLLCGLLLLNFSSTTWAASKKVSARSAVLKAVKKPLKASRHKPPRRLSTALPAVGSADILAADTVGLHGSASFYGHGFQGRRTSTGESYDVRQFSAASNHFPLGSKVAVRRLDKDLCAIVKINDRMAGHRRRIIDVSRGAAEYLDMLRAGVVLVRVARLKDDRKSEGSAGCRAAFDLDPECGDCDQSPRLPDFSLVP